MWQFYIYISCEVVHYRKTPISLFQECFASLNKIFTLGVILWSFSSNINEVIRVILNSFYSKASQAHKKKQNANKRIKIKNASKRHLRWKKPFICLFAFCAFAWVSLCRLVLLVLFCAFGAFGAFGVCEIFSEKKIKILKLSQ